MSSPMHAAVRPAQPSELPIVVDILAEAFAEDPFFDWLVLQDENAAKRRRTAFEAFVNVLGSGYGEIWITGGGEGAAIWYHPGRWQISAVTQLRLLPRLLRTTGLGAGWKKFFSVNSLERRHPKTPHFYLLTIGVVPACQGRGYGRVLLKPLLESCDSQRMPGYLETAKESNIAVYERYGFTVLEQLRLPFDGPVIWTMWRKGFSSNSPG